MRRKHLVTALAVVALGAPMTMFTASATADNDGIPECGARYSPVPVPVGFGPDKNMDGFVCRSNEPDHQGRIRLKDDH
jgi:hypothetical protein